MKQKRLKALICSLLVVIGLAFASYIFIIDKNAESYVFFSCILMTCAFIYAAYKMYDPEDNGDMIENIYRNALQGFLYVLNSGLSMFVLYGAIMKLFVKNDNIEIIHLVIAFFLLLLLVPVQFYIMRENNRNSL
jgi:hypothetical protein